MKKYEECATRLENRGDAPPTKEYVDALVEGILESGVEASWHSGVSPVGRALFPSKVVKVINGNRVIVPELQLQDIILLEL